MDLYELTMAQSYFHHKSDTLATFDLFVRDLPRNRSYLVAAGLEDILNYIRNLEFSREDLAYLRKERLFSEEFLGYLARFKFRGDLWAMPEGEIFFANEPIIRVTANIIEGQILESFLLNTVNLQTMIASKASRVVAACGDKGVYDFSLRRTHGSDAALKVARSAYLAGFCGTSNVLAGKLYAIPISGTMAHSFVMSFKHELDSFLAYSNTFPSRTTLLVDTYDTKKGIRNAVKVGLDLKEKGYRLQGIRLDSGDLVSLSSFARGELDAAGLNFAKIFASGNLDEFKIRDILTQGACIDNFGVGTKMGTSSDAPSLDAIYKLSEVTDEEGNFLPAMKLSKGKVTYPGRKQVFRLRDKRGRFVQDVVGLEREEIKGKALLKKVLSGGKVTYNMPALEKIRAFAKTNLSRFPDRFKKIDAPYRYPVTVSPKLLKLRNSLKLSLGTRQ
jgi:nicotinate phosphoribosyltransferase